ncbi:MAG: hypothetical protein A3B91_01850 [Candidatus Yanofskybacteria bacterium RIFCSPHIGHO2_02_FULL_41_29]|uniref:Uncharacterized protein n=1 Tax=Candidatus Yanofskybacteria bacterium RIFCSPHIGHO2_01_FULL_41_53 TaxID=1802663 RepID=A0A1F8EHP0_9BACT|nr:MAG: hypothetical protein A2650_04290 [Candidatus Yanofskybacteria bacterium RIFCSPHIGHO2_01_FULL_41_53]OGN11204.1 MAG: hypothetical protein A3B91_01850 [Candidatus Yanofskybacteria bacterium RIFCSPHIGHO2_02_FULL_41_29]OGN16951.1 MAG: hypothetical protein A3F48_00845 [Candidatus Yanofskybacteria bacterium RIFCSPHIGHO2_12_FULL_41_9]OGN22270.1 MAG: hypothetical protein A2916_04095 [Candidatus Yanofskybacteria bacterium RIFCSPLOWO2_01_FULL_41_67]OGN29638.1 MAG: hypothetical protein A3H54_00735 
MGKLSIKKYSLLCVAGGEVAFATCLIYGATLTGRFAEFHHTLFELLPGFTWFSAGSFIIGAITVGVWSGLGGAYIAWMHNYSLER